MNYEIVPLNGGSDYNVRTPMGCWFCLDLDPDGPLCDGCQMNLENFRCFLSGYGDKYLVMMEDPNA